MNTVLPVGLYLVRKRSAEKGVDHYGVLDIGNRIGHPAVGFGPVIIHQVREGQQLELLKPNDEWAVLHKVADEGHAIDRLNEARKNPHYKLFANNCEHFARYITTGKRESHQVNITLALAGLALIAFAR